METSDFYQDYSLTSVQKNGYQCRYYRGVNNSTHADLALFRYQGLLHYKSPPKKEPQQLAAFVASEPQTTLNPTDLSKWDGFFNYSITFLREDEGSFSMFRRKLIKLHPTRTIHFASTLMRKPVKALWFVSHCTAAKKHNRIYSAREEYVIELSKHISIDVFTSADKQVCFQRFKGLLNIHSNTKDPEIADYMFYLSFENNLCKDYITEKLWKVLELNGTTIPVVLGGLSIKDYEAVAPPNSFVHVRNFTSPKELAEHLAHVSQDDNAFHYYHQWRNEYSVVHSQGWNKTKYSFYDNIIGYLCELLHKRPPRVNYNLSNDLSSKNCLIASSPSVYCPYYNLTCNSLPPIVDANSTA
ncbi:3-galactosyl-N-acetylglucosaminide 4-alpha-L-fucosyltransferase FUT3-like [Watersipora subatra]|uniref:3-galactosyl-N-acetylglucosaminide 4-alpha-L-fucosyltransferase FUT3-like n=1 Tax=Watersipora subatra TaxID=2589382 RepID=UPI00355C98A1